MICILLVNIGLALYYANAAPYLAASAGGASRASVFSIQSALYAAAGFVGGLIGGYLPQLLAPLFAEGTRGPLPYLLTLVLVPLVLLYVVLSLLRMREPAPEPELRSSERPTAPTATQPGATTSPPPDFNAAQLAGRGALLLIAIFAMMRFLQVGGVGAATTFFNVYMDQEFRVPTSVIGNFQAAAKLIGIPVSLAIPWFTKRYGTVPVTLVASVLTVAAMMPMAFAPVWWAAGLGYMAVWIVTPVRYAAFTVYAMDRTPHHLRSTMNGAQEMLAGFSFALISFTGGFLISTLGYKPMFLLGAALSLAGAITLWLYDRRKRS